MNKLSQLKHYRKEYVKAVYGKMGKECGINPGVLWPRKEELDHMKQYEKAFHPRLEDLIAEHEAKKQEAIIARQQREQEVYSNLQKLPQELVEFFKKLRNREEEKKEWTKKRETAIEEIRNDLPKARK